MVYQITVYGRVHGVGFRYFVLHKAQSLGITGFVKNLSDGSVYCEAKASQQSLDSFVEICRQGPVRAVVTDISVIEVPDMVFNGFRIR
jgi:acylphosphatase